jgi:hypothetical protein
MPEFLCFTHNFSGLQNPRQSVNIITWNEIFDFFVYSIRVFNNQNTCVVVVTIHDKKRLSSSYLDPTMCTDLDKTLAQIKMMIFESFMITFKGNYFLELAVT